MHTAETLSRSLNQQFAEEVVRDFVTQSIEYGEKFLSLTYRPKCRQGRVKLIRHNLEEIKNSRSNVLLAQRLTDLINEELFLLLQNRIDEEMHSHNLAEALFRLIQDE